MLTPIFRKYKKIDKIIDEVCVIETDHGPRNKFRGRVYENQQELDEDIQRAMDLLLGEVGNDIDNVGNMFIQTKKQDDPYWEDSARDVLKAFLWAMLEDSDPKTCSNPITEDTFSFNTILTVIATFKDDEGTYYNDEGYFTNREKTDRKSVV